MVVSIGAVASSAQGISYYEKDGYYARDDPAHREASAWAGKGAEDLGLSGPVDPDLFKAVLEGKVLDGTGRQLGRGGPDGALQHRPGRDLTFSAPKSVSLAALIGGDGRVVDAHDRAVKRSLAWIEGNAAETRLKDPETGRMVRAGDQKTVAATFRHDASRNLDPQLHTHAVLANMVQGGDGKWRTMANEALYRREPAPGRARGADDPRPQARGRQGGAQGKLGEAGRRPGIRRADACRRRHGEGSRQGRGQGLRQGERSRAGCRSRFGAAGTGNEGAGGGGREMGGGASRRTRGGVLARRSAGGRAGLDARRGIR